MIRSEETFGEEMKMSERWSSTCAVSLLLIGLLVGLLSLEAAAQPGISLYAGSSLGSTTGGLIGGGTEVRLSKRWSTTLAFGLWPTTGVLADMFSPGDHKRYHWDVGLRIYPFARWVYAGMNYGPIFEPLLPDPDGNNPLGESYEVVMGYTATVGIRIPISDGFYINPFSGIRDGRRLSDLFKGERYEGYAPYYGVTIGYTL